MKDARSSRNSRLLGGQIESEQESGRAKERGCGEQKMGRSAP